MELRPHVGPESLFAEARDLLPRLLGTVGKHTARLSPAAMRWCGWRRSIDHAIRCVLLSRADWSPDSITTVHLVAGILRYDTYIDILKASLDDTGHGALYDYVYRLVPYLAKLPWGTMRAAYSILLTCRTCFQAWLQA